MKSWKNAHLGVNQPIETDLLVIGSGASGMIAALFAYDNGISPLIIEKSEFFGSSTA